MRFSIFVNIDGKPFHYRRGGFILNREKIAPDFKPDNYDTIEAATSEITRLIADGEKREVKIYNHAKSTEV